MPYKTRKVFDSFYAGLEKGTVYDTIHTLSIELHNNPNDSFFTHKIGDNDGAGYVGGIVDHLISRVVDGMIALPVLLFAILLAAILGPGLKTVIIVISSFTWMSYTRLVR